MKNKATVIITKTLFIMLAFAGFEHGLFETLQGYKSTGSHLIPAIGPEMQWWIHGSEDACTLIPNFLITGICAMCVSLFIMIWSICCLYKKNSATVILLLFILLVLVGGGIGFIPFFILTWAYATRINKSLEGWKRWLRPRLRKGIATKWPLLLIITAVCWLAAIEIAVFGYVPGVIDPDLRLAICWSLLLVSFVLINLTYISGFAGDIDSQTGEE